MAKKKTTKRRAKEPGEVIPNHKVQSPDGSSWPFNGFVSSICPTELILGAKPTDLWQTEEGFVVQIRAMSDLHLLNTAMMLINRSRKSLSSELTSETISARQITDNDENLLVELTKKRVPQFDAMLNELYFRGILIRPPKSF